MSRKVIKRLKIVVLLIIFVGFAYLAFLDLKQREYDRQALKIVFFDIGQGSAIFIQTPMGREVLIDAGPNRETLRRLTKYMNFWDRHIDILISTHPDSDHIAAFPEIVRNYSFDYFLKNRNIADTTYYQEMENRLNGERVVNVKMGDKIQIDENTHIIVFFPDTDTDNTETNTSSLIFKLVYREGEKEQSVLFTGDSPAKIERYLIGLFGDKLESDILVVGHHGSKTSTDENFLNTVSPKYSVIQAGRGNRFGHPHPSILERLERGGGEIRRTDLQGDIVFYLDGSKVRVK